MEVFMPRYDYRCSDCGHEFEVKQSFSDEPVALCPLCGVDSRRVIHSVPVVFKGSGFYVNDYGKGGGSNGRSKPESDDSSDSKSDSKSKESNDSKKSESAKDKEPASTT
jgi:putative FmdB family regulatory protein